MGITILDKTKKAPIFEFKGKPPIRTKLERDRWINEERRRWREGYQHLPGTYYFYLTQQFIKNRVMGGITRPMPRECDLILHEHIAADKKAGRPTGVFKPRGFGFSVQGGSLSFYHAINYPGSNSLLTSKESITIKDFFTQKVTEPLLEMDKDLIGPKKDAAAKYYNHPQPIFPVRLSESKSECYMQLAITMSRDEKGRPDKTELSQIITKETAASDRSATGFSGMGGMYGFIDEFPLHRRREMLMRSFRECFINPMTKQMEGWILWGGTCEETITDQELLEFKKTAEAFDKLGHNLIFFDYASMMFLDENGYPDRERAKKWHDAEMKAREGNEAELKAFLKLHPRSMDDIFEIASSDALEGDVINALKEQKRIVVQDNEPLAPVEITNIGGDVSYKVVQESPIKILEPPKPNISYVTLVDSMALGKEAGPHEGSDYCALMMKLYDPTGLSFMPVAYYKERPTKVDTAYWQTVRLSELYERRGGKFEGIMAEASNSTEEWFTNMLIMNGYGRYIMSRRDLSGKGNIDIRKSFQPVNNFTIDFQYRQANTFLRKHMPSMRLLPLIDELLMAFEENADMRSAFMMLFCAFPDINKEETAKEVRRERATPEIVINARGQRVRKVTTKNSDTQRLRASQMLKLAR